MDEISTTQVKPITSLAFMVPKNLLNNCIGQPPFSNLSSKIKMV
jgi:hypothetical protein